ncbi:hypothetical protein HFO56_03410 [Rhizobium laguerreae]|uniref:hypothetical protein n=1 Tax=Rhizobium laguerreae TaxID=1076926 RepID=UPI001C9042E0|nr:hypothetical protein [Rhizobium laguerreae]MBY3151436.1 hypothetical protein [Rhizobium laguerreae]
MVSRNDYYTYKRRVPSAVGRLDARYPNIRLALGTKDLGLARLKRDIFERADDEFWSALLEGSDRPTAEARYKTSIRKATALGFVYRHLGSV